MPNALFKQALIVGAGSGLSASLARALTREGLTVALAARSTDDLAALVRETGARAFQELDAASGIPDVVIYNASFRTRGPLADLDPSDVERSLSVTAFGAFLVAQQAVRRMLPRKTGAILLTGASAGVKGYPQSAPFAMGKFALRGLAQSMARELHPQGIHVAHIVIDGGIKSARRPDPPDRPDSMLDPDAIAETYLHLIHQPRSAWSWEVEVRPWVEKF